MIGPKKKSCESAVGAFAKGADLRGALARVRERARLHEGSFAAGPTPDGGCEVEAQIAL